MGRAHSRSEMPRGGRWIKGVLVPVIVAPWLAVVAATTATVLTASPAAGTAIPSSVTPLPVNDTTGYGGRATAVAINPADTNTAMVAAEAGGVFKTTDGGATWAHEDGLAPFRIEDLRYAPNNSEVVIAVALADTSATNMGGVWRSGDGGTTWTHPANSTPTCSPVTNPPGGRPNSESVGFAGTTNDVYVADDCGVILSRDSGQTWTRLAGSPAPSFAITAQPDGAGGSIADVCAQDGTHRYTTASNTWTAAVAIGNGCRGDAPHAISSSPYGAGVIFAAANSTNAGDAQLFESDNAGASWTMVGASKSFGQGRQNWIGVHRSADGVAGDVDIYFGTGLDMYRTTCTSPTTPHCTNPLSGPLTIDHPDQGDIAFSTSPTSNCPQFVASDGGLHKTSDCGATWSLFGAGSAGYEALQIYDLTGQVHPGCLPASASACQTDLYIGTQDNQLWASGDNGATWPYVTGNEGYFIQVPHKAPSDAGQLVVWEQPVTGNPNFKSGSHFSGAAGWNNPPGAGNQIAPPWMIAPNTFIEVTQPSPPGLELWYTNDGGATWSDRGAIAMTTGPAHIAGPASDPTVYFGVARPGGTVGIERITGIVPPATLTVTGPTAGLGNLPSFCPGHGAWVCPPVYGVDPNDPLHLIAADIGSNTMKQSRDGGATWSTDSQLTNLVTANGKYAFNAPNGMFSNPLVAPHAISFDPTNGQRILVGTEAAGIIASSNGGYTWAKLPGSEQAVNVSDFFFDEVNQLITVATYGRGLWRLDMPTADLTVSVTHSPEPVTAGRTVSYDITVSNAGPDAAPAVSVVDILPLQASYVTDTLAGGGGCTALPAPPGPPSPQVLVCPLGDMAAGASRSFTIDAAVSPSAVSSSGAASTTIVNQVSASSPVATDPNPDDNTARDVATVVDSADLSASKLCKPDTTIYQGTPIGCSVIVDNHGPSYSRNVVIDDLVKSDGPVSVTGIAVVPGPTNCTLTAVTGGQDLRCTVTALANESTTQTGRVTLNYTIAGTSTSANGQDIDNTASVQADTPDPNPANNAAAVNLTVTAVADLGLSMTAPPATAAGLSVTWTLKAHDNGPSDAANVSITDTVPAGVAITSVSMPGGSCVTGVAGDPAQPSICTFGTLAVGTDSAVMTITAVIDPSTTGTLSNNARVDSATFDNNSANNLAQATSAVTVVSSLSASISATPNPVIAGTPLSYQVTVGNSGPSTATGVSLTDPLPAGLMFVSTGGAGACGFQTDTNTVACALPNLNPGQTAVVYVYTSVKSSTPAGSITNTATAKGTGSADASGSVATTVETRADLAVSLTSDAAKYKPSSTIHYTVTLVNNGPSDAQSVVITQKLPAVKQGKYLSNSLGCPAPVSGTLTCSYTVIPVLVTVPAGGSLSFQVNFYVTGNKQTVSSTASVTSATTDPVASNNSSTRYVTVA